MVKKKILIIEDNVMNMELFSDLLEFEGYSISKAINGKDGFNMAKRNKPNLILLDIGLPDMRGIEAVRKFKEDPITKDIILVICTASIMKEEKEEIMNTGCDGFIAKPIDAKEFIKTINGFLRN